MGGRFGALREVSFGQICLKSSALEGISDRRCCHLGECRKRWEEGTGPNSVAPQQGCREPAHQERRICGGRVSSLCLEKTDCWEPKCPPRDEWINQTQYVPTMEYYLALRRKEILTHATTWISFEDIMLNETNQTQIGQLPYNSTYMKYLASSTS